MKPTKEMNVTDVLEKLSREIGHSVKYPECVNVQINSAERAVIKVGHCIAWWAIPFGNYWLWSIRIKFYFNHRYQYEMIIKSFDPMLAIKKVIKAFKR